MIRQYFNQTVSGLERKMLVDSWVDVNTVKSFKEILAGNARKMGKSFKKGVSLWID